MFSKILIANRGEIACRVMRTAREMGIQTVAVYSQADRHAVHTLMADEAVDIGPSPASESYLCSDKIITACKQTGAEAVHPGYGFLSERASFVRELAAEGIAFIGPSANAVDAMGDKITSRKIAEDAGVPTVPGHTGGVASLEEAHKIAKDIGYPVMIKASAGGGGKGMRVAFAPDELEEGLTRAKSEAASSFGDDRVFIEKFIVSPRHIEIQILADNHGHALWLGERECSIQRRNQKVIEEAPSPSLTSKTREKMGACAVALAKAVGYSSAGTVEFVVDQDENFYFLEMNTRLQVEHPVTEFTTGLDLVEQMIRIAAGEPLSLTQDSVRRSGHAIEARICAEDPEKNFMPAIGRLLRYEPAATGTKDGITIRVDSGVCEGSEISMYYDPMIAKLIAFGANRDQAIAGLQSALDEFVIRGLGHNIPFLSAILAEQKFQKGETTTGFISDVWPDGFSICPPEGETFAYCLVAAAAIQQAIDSRPRNSQATFKNTGFRHSCETRKVADYVITARGTVLQDAESQSTDKDSTSAAPCWHVELLPSETTPLSGRAKLDGHEISYAGDWHPNAAKTHFRFGDGLTLCLQVEITRTGMRLETGGRSIALSVLTPRRAELLALLPEPEIQDDRAALLCPMPGLVIALNVQEGDAVEEGDIVAIVEAMKMENALKAPRSGRIASLPVEIGQSLSVGATIMEFEDGE